MIADLEFIIKTVSDFLGGGYEWWGSIKSDNSSEWSIEWLGVGLHLMWGRIRDHDVSF
jgi:hypothetical protein